MFATATSAASALLWPFFGGLPQGFAVVPWFAVPHAAWLLSLLARSFGDKEVPAKMMTLMIASLTYVLWFILPPFVAMLIGRS
jgi:hypothetical protein